MPTRPGHIGGAAADDREPGEGPRVDRPVERLQPHRRHVDVVGERVPDDLGLLVDLLGHEVAIIALLGEQASGRAALDAPLRPCAGGVEDLGAGAGDDDPVALLEIGDAVGEGGERQRVGAEIHLAVAVADRERRALARADEQVVMALEQIDEREGAAKPRERREHRLGRRLAGLASRPRPQARRSRNRSRWRSRNPWPQAPRAAP